MEKTTSEKGRPSISLTTEKDGIQGTTEVSFYDETYRDEVFNQGTSHPSAPKDAFMNNFPTKAFKELIALNEEAKAKRNS